MKYDVDRLFSLNRDHMACLVFLGCGRPPATAGSAEGPMPSITVPHQPPAPQEYPAAAPKTRSSTPSYTRRPLSEAERAAQQREVEQACRSFMSHVTGADEGPTADFGDEQLGWYDDLESRVRNLIYVHRTLLKSLILRESCDPKVLMCVMRLAELPEAEGPRKGTIWGLPNWMVGALLLWIALFKPQEPVSGQPALFATFLFKQARNQITALLDICRLQLVMCDYIIIPPTEVCKHPRLFISRLGLPPLPFGAYTAILRTVLKTFAQDVHFNSQVKDLHAQIMKIMGPPQAAPVPSTPPDHQQQQAQQPQHYQQTQTQVPQQQQHYQQQPQVQHPQQIQQPYYQQHYQQQHQQVMIAP